MPLQSLRLQSEMMMMKRGEEMKRERERWQLLIISNHLETITSRQRQVLKLLLILGWYYYHGSVLDVHIVVRDLSEEQCFESVPASYLMYSQACIC